MDPIRNRLMIPSAPPLRTLSSPDLAGFLRIAVGLPPLEANPAVDRTPVTIDAEAWAAWCLAGLHACALPTTRTSGEDDDDETKRRGPWVPSVRVMGREARRVAVVVAMHRHGGNLSRAATALGMSRRALREASAPP